MEATHTRLYQLPGGLFLKDAPIFVLKGGLWQSKESAALFGNLQLKNIEAAKLQSVTVKLTPFATNGGLLGDGVFYTYETQAGPNGTFGETELIPLPDNACAFGTCVTKAVFEDGSTWEPENTRAWHVADEGYKPQAPTKKK